MNRVPAILLLLIACPSGHGAEPALITSPSKSPLVSFRILFHTGAVDDATGQEGTAALTAAMVSEGGTKQMAYGDIVEALFPMAASVNAQVDKEMTVFHGTTHVENLDQYYEILRAMLFEPGWRKEDFQRLNQDFLFGRPGTDRIADRRLRCNGFRTTATFGTPFAAAPAFESARSCRSGDRRGLFGNTSPAPILGNPRTLAVRALGVTLPAQAAPRSSATCRRTACGSDAPRPAAANSTARA